MCSFERAASLSHDARLYRREDELEEDMCSFIAQGAAAGEPALILAPRSRVDALRGKHGQDTAGARFEDMQELGLNPARIIPALLEWTERHSGPVRILCEPLWHGRSHEEAIEVLRHEALIESALEGTCAKVVCVFVEQHLVPCARASLERSHHTLRDSDGAVCERRAEPHSIDEVLGEHPLGPPGAGAQQLPVGGGDDLSRVRRQVAASEATARLSPAQRMDFVLALNEAASNALEYGQPPHALRLWSRDGEVIGEITGAGGIEDPLAGRRRPDPEAFRGRGLWMVNQLCDLVELRSTGSRTTVRMHKQCR